MKTAVKALSCNNILNACKSFWRSETVFCIAAAAALLSACRIHPSLNYFKYVNFGVLEMLFCLMAAAAGWQKIGIFNNIAIFLNHNIKKRLWTSYLLTAACFVSALLITNDVALIIFVPFTIKVLGTERQKELILTVVMETVASNLGSMLAPIGNPQNLFIFSFYKMDAGDFMSFMLPWWIVSFILISLTYLASSFMFAKESAEESQSDYLNIPAGGLLLYSAVFVFCLLAIAKVISAECCFVMTLACLLVKDRSALKKIDYVLLLTFVCFFVFVGNLSAMADVRMLISRILNGHELIVGALTSQIISNVPAAVMLANFTAESKDLLLGVNLGGLGTLVGSLASLISSKLYSKSQNSRSGMYLLIFSLINFVFLLVLLSAAEIML
ncbi:citrate transporter [bacterium]|nr:citrate transporter [bacterium]